ncbi:MAG: ribbon-helix-helix protein, CopG family [Chloroflexi bacterium]|nr:ribbon-helix-helix protein, CopG family [Chloroflexota bacterium]
MTAITIAADDALVGALQNLARQKQTTLEVIVREALADYVRLQIRPRRKYSFIGIGHSGKRNLSVQVEEILERAANRREGWSLAE